MQPVQHVRCINLLHKIVSTLYHSTSIGGINIPCFGSRLEFDVPTCSQSVAHKALTNSRRTGMSNNTCHSIIALRCLVRNRRVRYVFLALMASLLQGIRGLPDAWTPSTLTKTQHGICIAAQKISSMVTLRSFASASLAEDVKSTEPSLPPIPLSQQTSQGEYRDLEVTLYDINRNPIGSVILSGDVFDVPVRKDILHRVVRWQLARRQQGTHKTKTRSEVRGGGRKPWKQKGSGRARQGTIRAPQWRGGGIVHGPVPRSHEHKLLKRIRRLGLKCALSAKAWERRLTVVDSLRPADHRTKTMDGHLSALLEGAARRSALLVDSDKCGLDGGCV